MRFRSKGVILLSVSTVAFAGMVILVYTGVTALRRARDLKFGLEDLDVVLRDNRYSEAEAMTPWLAERTPTASGALSVLRRALQVAEVTGMWESFNSTAEIAIERFPGNETLRGVAVYAAYRVGDVTRALDWASRYLQSERYADLYGLTLLAANAPLGAKASDEEDLPVALRLSSLGNGGTPEEFLAAWRLTHDWRYALDAVALLMLDGRGSAARETVTNSSLPLYAPLFAYEVLIDRGEYGDALLAVERAATSPPDGKTSQREVSRSAILLRKADALVRLGRFAEAEAAYREVVLTGDTGSGVDIAHANLAWLAETPEDAKAILTDAIADGVSSWNVYEQLALLLAIDDPEKSAVVILSALEKSGGDARQRLLALRLDDNPDRRGFAASLWMLLNDEIDRSAMTNVQRFALWYFYTRGLVDDLSLLLDRPTLSGSWQSFYRGLLLGAEREWAQSADQFAAADSILPSWYTAYNAGIASLRAGKVAQGEAFLLEAERRAELSAYPQRSEAVLLARARITDDPAEAIEWVDRAIRINPTSASALRLRSLLSP